MVKPSDAPSSAAQVAKDFLDALGRRQFDEVERLLAPDVWFRALMPRGLEEKKTSCDARALLSSWYAGAAQFRLLERAHHSLEGREHLRYRFLLKPDWQPERWHVIEQVGFCRVKDGRISRLDLDCTGFFPVEHEDVLPSGRAARSSVRSRVERAPVR